MKSTVFATSILALTVGILPFSASAADLGNKGDPTAADYVAPISWTGFYVGGRIGYGNANHELTVQRYNGGYCWDQVFSQLDGDVNTTKLDDPTALHGGWNFGHWSGSGATSDGEPVFGKVYAAEEGGCAAGDIGAEDAIFVDPSERSISTIDGLNSHGIIGGGVIGGDYQTGRFVFGVFGSYDFSGMETTGNIGGISNPDGVAFDVNAIEKGDEWSLGARAGYLVNQRTLVYLLAAYTQTEYDFSGTDGAGDAFSKATTFDGVSVGGGIEFAMTQNVFLGLEYVHTFYGEETVLDTGGSEVGGFGEKVIDDLDEDKIMATLKVKLNSGLGF
jgi:outer membrane immunogenic protein